MLETGSVIEDRRRAASPSARFGLLSSLVLFGIPAVWLWLATHQLLPWLVNQGVHPLLAWFLSGSVALAPLLAAGLVVAARDAGPSFRAMARRLRIFALDRGDWLLVLAVLGAVAVTTGLLFVLMTALDPGFRAHPDFLTPMPLRPGEMWLLAAWVPFFLINIIGEEVWWRGAIQPAQEPVFGRLTFLVQAVLWTAFHTAFGWRVTLLATALLVLLPWAVQRRANTTVGIVLHAALNGPAFIALALGILPH